MIQEAVNKLIQYGLQTGILMKEDSVYATNRILDILKLDTFEEGKGKEEELEIDENCLEGILKDILNYAFEKGLMEDNTVTSRDLFDTRIMDALLPRPSEVIRRFREDYKISPDRATEKYYKFSMDSNYIRRDRISKDKKWSVNSPYGAIDITINLSKPEKDPVAIAKARFAAQSGYPKCQLCMENEGFAGTVSHPARQNHRIIPIKINEEDWGFQYSPYVYYNEHCIVLNQKHIPMSINRDTFEKLLSFIEQFPHYFVGSNADLPIVGGSILSHEHFQGGHYTFAMAKASIEKEIDVKGYDGVTAGILHWPMSVIRAKSKNKEKLVAYAAHVLACWRTYSDREAFIFAKTEETLHNTITPIARKNGDQFELDLVLRNNITTEERPLGVYHPRPAYHNIKKENIGLIEVMGLAILPRRLTTEMSLLAKCLVNGEEIASYDELQKHVAWVQSFAGKYDSFTKENVDEILKKEIGEVFVHVLEDAGVFKCSPQGRKYFDRFVKKTLE